MKNLPPLFHACSTDPLRVAFQNVFIDGTYGVATNGHILVKVDLTKVIPDDVLKLLDQYQIPAKTWKLLCSNDAIRLYVENDKVLVSTSYGPLELKNNADMRFPDYRATVKEYNNPVALDTIGFSAKEIGKALKSVCATQFKIQFFGSNKGAIARPLFCDFDAEILIMPIMIGEVDQKEPFLEIIRK